MNEGDTVDEEYDDDLTRRITRLARQIAAVIVKCVETGVLTQDEGRLHMQLLTRRVLR